MDCNGLTDAQNAKELISNMISSGVTNFIYTDIEKDGTFQGVSIETIESITKEYHLNLIVAGGISSIDDIKNLSEIKAPEFFVFNLDQSHLKGSHWCLLIFDHNAKCEIFDSLISLLLIFLVWSLS